MFGTLQLHNRCTSIPPRRPVSPAGGPRTLPCTSRGPGRTCRRSHASTARWANLWIRWRCLTGSSPCSSSAVTRRAVLVSNWRHLHLTLNKKKEKKTYRKKKKNVARSKRVLLVSWGIRLCIRLSVFTEYHSMFVSLYSASRLQQGGTWRGALVCKLRRERLRERVNKERSHQLICHFQWKTDHEYMNQFSGSFTKNLVEASDIGRTEDSRTVPGVPPRSWLRSRQGYKDLCCWPTCQQVWWAVRVK